MQTHTNQRETELLFVAGTAILVVVALLNGHFGWWDMTPRRSHSASEIEWAQTVLEESQPDREPSL